MDENEDKADSFYPSESRPHPPLPIACDVCYIRKIRCDRKNPCGTCIDTRVPCQRDRQKIERKSRENFPKEVSEAIIEIKGRMSTLESSINHLINLSTKPNVDIHSPRERPKKRARADIQNEGFSQHTSPHGIHSPYITTGSESHLTPPFSAFEACTLIQDELGRVPSLSMKKQAAFHSALSSLRQSLNTSIINHDFPSTTISEEALGHLSIPPLSLIQWMLQSYDTGRSVASGADFMPFTSRKTIAGMAKDLLGESINDNHIASLICVTAYAGYFLQEIVLTKQDNLTGLEDQLRLQANEYFAAARAATSRILKQAPSNLANLQALTYGVLLAQEAGEFAAAWLLTEVASNMCINLNLHKRANAFSNSTPDVAREAYYCFTVCYQNDKGLAMNLGRPSFLQDSIIEIDIFTAPNSERLVLDNFRIYLKLAQIQSCIINELRPAKAGNHRTSIMSSILTRMDHVWQLNKELKRRTREDKEHKYDSEMESTMVDFAFYSVKTVIFHAGTETLHNSEYNHAALDAARSALSAVQRAQELSRGFQYSSIYMKISFAHWTILYYPFTSFFVLLCNVISTRNILDYNLMQQFVAYLSETKHISISIAKLHKLCIPFCSLAFNILNSEGENDTNTPSEIYPHLKNNDHNNNNNDNDDEDSSRGLEPPPHHTDSWQVQDMQMQAALHQHQPPPALHLLHHPVVPSNPYARPVSFTSDAQPAAAPSLQLHNLEQPGGDAFQSGDFLWNFMGTQPMLQWLDSDFSELKGDWNVPENYFPPPPP